MSTSKGGAGQVAVPGHDQKLAIPASYRSREVHRVVSAEPVFLGEPAGLTRKRFIDADERHGGRRLVEISHRSA